MANEMRDRLVPIVKDSLMKHIDEFGKSVFPNEDQAEQKLKEMRGENDA